MKDIRNMARIKILELEKELGHTYKTSTLPMPNIGESVDIVIHAKEPYTPNLECSIVGNEYTYNLRMTPAILKDIIRDLMKDGIPVDDDMKCIIGHIFTITCEEWLKAPKNFYKFDDTTNKYEAPKIYHATMK